MLQFFFNIMWLLLPTSFPNYNNNLLYYVLWCKHTASLVISCGYVGNIRCWKLTLKHVNIRTATRRSLSLAFSAKIAKNFPGWKYVKVCVRADRCRSFKIKFYQTLYDQTRTYKGVFIFSFIYTTQCYQQQKTFPPTHKFHGCCRRKTFLAYELYSEIFLSLCI